MQFCLLTSGGCGKNSGVMARILLAGIGPLPSEAQKQLFAPGLRVSIFAQTLHEAGHEVSVALGQFGELEKTGLTLRHWPPEADPAEVHAASLNEAFKLALAQVKPDVVVATTDVMARAAVESGTDVPLWVDFYGSPMAERQQQAFVHSHDGGIAAAWRMILPALLRADAFSVCSNYQRLALIGELGTCGRLNQFTAGQELVHVIPPGNAFAELLPCKPSLRGKSIPEDAFIVLWTGGYNTWTDVDTLYRGLIQAMEQSPDIHFVSTGGAIPGQCETVYPEFVNRIAHGPHRERFHLLGWVDLDVVHSAWQEANLAVNIDQFSYEGLLGTRTRLLDWMQAKLAIATTPLSELNEMLVSRSLAWGFAIGDANALTSVILHAQHHPEERREMAERAYAFLRDEWRNEHLLKPLLEWIGSARRAPDQLAPRNSLAAAQHDMASRSVEHERMSKLEFENEALNQQINRLQGSRIIRAIMRLKNMPMLDTSAGEAEDRK